MKKRLRQWLWLGIGAVVIGLIFYNLRENPEWRNFSWRRFWESILDARLNLLLLSLLGIYATYFVRAYRWRCFMLPMKKASYWVLFVGQVLGFSSIFLIGRPGEFVRPAYIAKKENVPISGMVAIWLLERIFDSVMLVLVFAAALYFEPVGPATPRGVSVLATMHRGGDWMFVMTGVLVVGLVLFRLYADRWTKGMLRLLRFLSPGKLRHLEHFLRSFQEGLGVIRSWSALVASLASTAFLWFLNISVVWLVFQSLGGGLETLPWLAAALTMFCAALGLVVQFPGIGGGYQVGAILALTEIFNVAAEPATGAGILIWIIVSVPCLALGLVLLIREGLTFRKLEEIAAEEEQAVRAEDAS